MNQDLQSVLAILAMGAIAFISIIIAGIVATVCFHFPRKCSKCGKYWAFIRTKPDKTAVYTAGGYLTSEHHISQKVCVSCGFEDEPKLIKKTEGYIRD